jgi:peptidoglycan/LPS O-acetylase OafA/YrhL
MANLEKSINMECRPVEKERTIPELDGLRGIAILCVLCDHFFEKNYFFHFGWTGVNLFFVLSGYLITGRLLHHASTEGGKNYFRNFYARRILRIFPLYYMFLAGFFFFLPLVYDHYGIYFSNLRRDQLWYWTYLDNWKVVFSGPPDNLILLSLWSLAVEEQFYLFWPVIYRYVKGLNLKRMIVFLIVASIGVRILTGVPFHHAYYSTLTACEPLLMGAGLFILVREGQLVKYHHRFGIAAFVSFVALCIIFIHQFSFETTNAWLMKYGYSAIDVLWAYLLYRAVTGSISLKKALTRKWLIWLGKYSYGIYVYHFVIFQMMVWKLDSMLAAKGIENAIAYPVDRALGLLVTLLCSFASYHLFEKHFLTLKKYFR